VLLLRPQGLMPEERRVSIWVERHVKRLDRSKRMLAEQAESAPD